MYTITLLTITVLFLVLVTVVMTARKRLSRSHRKSVRVEHRVEKPKTGTAKLVVTPASVATVNVQTATIVESMPEPELRGGAFPINAAATRAYFVPNRGWGLMTARLVGRRGNNLVLRRNGDTFCRPLIAGF